MQHVISEQALIVGHNLIMQRMVGHCTKKKAIKLKKDGYSMYFHRKILGDSGAKLGKIIAKIMWV